MGRRRPRREYNKKVHPSKRRMRREVHKCTQCDKKFPKFEDIKIHFLETHTKWMKDESSVEKRPTNISTENESTSSETTASNDLAPTANEKEAGNLSNHNFCQETLFSNPTSNSKTQKVQIFFECSWMDCGKCFKSFGDLEIHRKTQHVDKSSKKCTKCDAEFDSFEILKQHFLQSHTKWRKAEVATSTQSMYSDSGDDSCDEKMMLTIETMQGPDSEEKLVMTRPGAKLEPDHIDS